MAICTESNNRMYGKKPMLRERILKIVEYLLMLNKEEENSSNYKSDIISRLDGTLTDLQERVLYLEEDIEELLNQVDTMNETFTDYKSAKTEQVGRLLDLVDKLSNIAFKSVEDKETLFNQLEETKEEPLLDYYRYMSGDFDNDTGWDFFEDDEETCHGDSYEYDYETDEYLENGVPVSAESFEDEEEHKTSEEKEAEIIESLRNVLENNINSEEKVK